MDWLYIPLEPDIAESCAKAEKAIRIAMRNYAGQNGLFIEEVTSRYHGIKKRDGAPCLAYTILETKRK